MKTMKRILTAALVATALGAGLGAGMDAMKVEGCKPGIHPKSAEMARNGGWNKREQRRNGTAVAAVRG